MESVKRARLEGGGYTVFRNSFGGGGGGRRHEFRQAVIRDCGDHLQFDLIGVFSLSDGSVMVLGSHYFPFAFVNRCVKIVKLPPLTLKLPKNLPHNITLEKLKEQVFEEAFKKFYNARREEKAQGTSNMRYSNVRAWNQRMLLDTGASKHSWGDKAMFSTYKPFPINTKVVMANGTTSDAVGSGNVVLKMAASGLELTLENVLHVPDSLMNLVSGSQLGKAGIKQIFENDKAVLTKNGQFLGDAYLQNGLFVLNATIVYPRQFYM